MHLSGLYYPDPLLKIPAYSKFFLLVYAVVKQIPVGVFATPTQTTCNEIMFGVFFQQHNAAISIIDTLDGLKVNSRNLYPLWFQTQVKISTSTRKY